MKLYNHSPWWGSRCELEIRSLADEVPSSSPEELTGRSRGVTSTVGTCLPRAQ